MNQPTWTGFDQRKICPRCGGYQTRFSRSEPSTAQRPPAVLLWLVVLASFLLTGLTILILVNGAAFRLEVSFVLVLTVLLLVGGLIAYRIARRDLRGLGPVLRRVFRREDPGDSPPESPSLGRAQPIYALHCSSCGYRWQKTAEAWEREGQRDVADLSSQPPGAPSPDQAAVENLDKIAWVPPNKARGILIITGVVIVFLLVSAVLLGMLFSRSQLSPDSTFVGLLILLLLLIGLGFITKAKPARLIPAILLLVFGVVLLLLLR